jgi:hypothetical protein
MHSCRGEHAPCILPGVRRRAPTTLLALLAVGVTFGPREAFAQSFHVGEPASGARPINPVPNSLELGVSFGYEQGFGVPAHQPTLGGPTAAGGSLQLDLGWRPTPPFELGVYGSVGLLGLGLAAPNTTKVFGSNSTTASAGIQGAWHILPNGSFDPWVSVGTGWRGYWVPFLGGNGTESFQGLDVARFRVGLDYRAFSTLALSPVAGVDLSTFLEQHVPGVSGWHGAPSDFNAFLFLGIAGRVDFPVNPKVPKANTATR